MVSVMMSGTAASIGAYLTCPTCNGDGFVQFDGSVRETRTDSCGTCGGRGTILANTGLTPEASAPSTPGMGVERRNTKTIDERSWLGEGARAVRSPED